MKKPINNNTYLFFHCFIFVLLSLIACSSFAGVIIHATRVIYPESSREVTIRLENKGDKPALIQAWIDDGNQEQAVENLTTPFMVMPPVFRIEAGNGQTVRISYTGERSLPKNKESVFWLNVLDIPPKPDAAKGVSLNNLQIAIKSRIKFFYRPGELNRDEAREAAEKLTWNVTGNGSTVRNNSPYFITLSAIEDAQGRRLTDAEMIAPNESKHLIFKRSITSNEKLKYYYIDDLGARIPADLKV